MENVIYCKTSEQLRTVAQLNLKRPSYTTDMDHETPSAKVCCLNIFFCHFFTNLNCKVGTWQRELLPSVTAFVSEFTNTQTMLWSFESFKFDSPTFVLTHELKCLTWTNIHARIRNKKYHPNMQTSPCYAAHNNLNFTQFL